MTTYQPFHDLPAGQYEALKRDIEVRGVILPILVDENGRTIDGHQRRRAAAEVGVECPIVQVSGLTEDEKIGLAFTLNLFRRHLSSMERSQAIGELARRGLSTRRMSDLLGLSKSAIHRDIQELEAAGEVERPDTVFGKDGRDQPSHKPDRTVPSRDTCPPEADPETGEVVLPVGNSESQEDGAPAPSTSGVSGDGGTAARAPEPADPRRQLRDAWHTEITRATSRLITLEPADLAGALAMDDAAAALASVRQIRGWCDRVEESLTKRTLKAV